MPSLLLRDVEGTGGGYFSLEASVKTQVSGAATEQSLVLPEVDDKVYKIRTIATSTGLAQGVTLTVDGVDLFTNASVGKDGTGDFSVQQSGNSALSYACIQEIYCKSFSIVKAAGPTTNITYVAYEIGEFK